MKSACTIVVQQLKNGNYKATCALYPDAQAVAPTYQQALSAFEKFIEEQVHQQQDIQREEPSY
jgi:hypothetical protein